MDKRLTNIILLSIAILLLYTGAQTMGSIQKTIIDSIKKDTSFEENGYYSQAINSAFFSVFTWAVPSVIHSFGVKLTLCLGALLNVLFILQFLLEKVWILYVFCSLAGFGTALLGAALGNYVSLNSSENTINRNTAIFTIISSFNMITGNIIVMCGFSGHREINKHTRILVLAIFAGVSAIGLIVFLFLPKHQKEEKSKDISDSGAVESFLEALKLSITKNMLLLGVIFMYGGILSGFMNGIYSSALGFTQNLQNSKQLVGLSGIFVGIGEIFGGSVVTIFGKKVVDLGRNLLTVIACSLHSLSYILIFINLPNNSPFGDTTDKAIIESNTVLAMFCSFLLGLGDCIYVNVIFSLIGTIYSENSATAFSILQFFVGIASVIDFLTADYLGMYYQVATLFILGILGTTSLITVNISSKQNKIIEHKSKTEISQ